MAIYKMTAGRRTVHGKCGGRLRASFTVEAAVFVPLIFVTVLGALRLGFSMREQIEQAVQITEDVNGIDPVKIVRKSTQLEGLLEKE